jgi:hypothetical protein
MIVNPLIWKNWIGFKHEVGADPRYTDKCCCFKLIQAIYEELNLGQIPFSDDWYELFNAGKTEELKEILYTLSAEIPYPSLWSVLHFTLDGKFGMGIVVQDYRFLVPHHQTGLRAFPLRVLPPESRRYFKPI